MAPTPTASRLRAAAPGILVRTAAVAVGTPLLSPRRHPRLSRAFAATAAAGAGVAVLRGVRREAADLGWPESAGIAAGAGLTIGALGEVGIRLQGRAEDWLERHRAHPRLSLALGAAGISVLAEILDLSMDERP